MPNLLTFEDWLIENYPDWEDEAEDGTCEECDGKGLTECPTCGEETLECEYCHGEMVKSEPKKEYREEYDLQKANDLERLKRWGDPPL